MNPHDLKIALASVSEDGELGQFLRFLPYGWKSAMAGVGTGLVHFFVRSHRIKNGKPAAYDPFWIESCLLDERNEMAALKQRTTDVVDGKSWEPPLMPLARPFGPLEDAERAPCDCGRAAYVVGSREFPGLCRREGQPFRQALYVLCLACPKLALLAQREDSTLVKLHP